VKSVPPDVLGPYSASSRRGKPFARAALLSVALLAACGDGAVQTSASGPAAAGSLTISVEGLPDGSLAMITVSSAQGFRRELTGPAVLEGLAPGTYLVTASPVTIGQDRYDASPASRSIGVTAGPSGLAAVSYSVATGRIQLTVVGLPSGAAGSVTVSGPGGYLRQAAASETLAGLAPGTYAVDASSIASADTTYLPAPASQSAELGAGEAAPIGVTYAPSYRATTLNLSVNGLYLTQATQRFDGTVPLVAGRDAYLRVFVLANEANLQRPQVRVRLYNGATLVRTATIAASAVGVPVVLDEGTLARSWNVAVPGALVQPGLRVLADVDPESAIAEVSRADNRFPATGIPQAVDVRVLPSWDVRFVPVVQQVNGLQGNIAAANTESYLADPRAMLPVGDYSAEVRTPYTTSAPVLQSDNANRAWNSVLSELMALRVADASSRYYYGVVATGYTSGTVGLGYVGGAGRTAVGWDRLPGASNVMAHEEGHNLGRQHAPCGGAGSPDPAFPYPGGTIGVWGLDLRSLTSRSPATTPDLMGYCGGNWISDYDWSWMISYRGSGPNTSAGSEPGGGPGLLVWGRIGEAGVVLEPAFKVAASPETAPPPGPFRLDLLAADGAVLRSVGFDAALVADLPGAPERHFAFVVPLDTGLDQRLAALAVHAGTGSVARFASPVPGEPETVLARLDSGQAELRWNSIRYPMVLVRDAATGQILSFARGGRLRFLTRATQLELLFSDGVRSPLKETRILQ
jgi:hypothetical protein